MYQIGVYLAWQHVVRAPKCCGHVRTHVTKEGRALAAPEFHELRKMEDKQNKASLFIYLLIQLYIHSILKSVILTV